MPKFAPRMAQDEIKHDPHSGRFSAGGVSVDHAQMAQIHKKLAGEAKSLPNGTRANPWKHLGGYDRTESQQITRMHTKAANLHIKAHALHNDPDPKARPLAVRASRKAHKATSFAKEFHSLIENKHDTVPEAKPFHRKASASL